MSLKTLVAFSTLLAAVLLVGCNVSEGELAKAREELAKVKGDLSSTELELTKTKSELALTKAELAKVERNAKATDSKGPVGGNPTTGLKAAGSVIGAGGSFVPRDTHMDSKPIP